MATRLEKITFHSNPEEGNAKECSKYHTTALISQAGKVMLKILQARLLFNLYAEYIMWNARLDEAQAGIKISRKNVNNLRYADDTTLITESKEELKSLLMKVKEESKKAGLKAQHSEK